jgi:hypothetical protein
MHSALWVLSKPPHTAFDGVSAAVPSVLPFIQFTAGGCHMISLISGAFGGWRLILNVLRMLNSEIELPANLLVLFPERETLAMTKFIAHCQGINLSKYLSWFLTNQMTFNMFKRANGMTILHWGDQPLSGRSLTLSNEVNWIVPFKILASHLQKFMAYLHWKNRWKNDSWVSLQQLHIETSENPCKMRCSSVGIFLCINLHASKDLEGGMSGD